MQSVIAARPAHHLMITEAPEWVLEDMNNWMRSFFWAGKDKCNGGQCLVAWDKICRPKLFSGLGIKNLKWQATALRVRWEWLKRTDSQRPWQGLPMMEDIEMREVFDALINIKVGSGEKVLFWRDKWIHGVAAADVGGRRRTTGGSFRPDQDDKQSYGVTGPGGGQMDT